MRVLKIILRKIKRLADKIFGSKTDELYWRFRHIFDKKWAESYISKESINHPHRKFLIEKICSYYPFETILEIGCASGPNLYLLVRKFPNVKFYGIDISKAAIKKGKNFFRKQKIKNIYLEVSKADNLSDFKSKSIDIIFTDATLIYLGKDKIKTVLKEIIRVAKKVIIFFEWHSESSNNSFYHGHWVHNYKELFKNFVREEKIKVFKTPIEGWGGGWIKYGHIIEVIL